MIATSFSSVSLLPIERIEAITCERFFLLKTSATPGTVSAYVGGVTTDVFHSGKPQACSEANSNQIGLNDTTDNY